MYFFIFYFLNYLIFFQSIFINIILFNFEILFIVLFKTICVLITVAYFTIAERKIMAAIQRRLGPNVEGGPFGFLQPLADGLKLFIKELIIPSRSNIFVFFLAPILIFTLSITGWSIIPFYQNNFFKTSLFLDFSIYKIIVNLNTSAINYGILFLLAISSLNVYGIILGGWASNSKYAFLGALRSAAQMISYEVSIGLTILPVILLSSSFNLTEIVMIQKQTIWFFFPLFPFAIIFFISMLAETNRAPFDLPEAEAELVAGYNVEYSAMAFALFFLGEYSNMLLMASFLTLLFYGGWLVPFFGIFNYHVFVNIFFFSFKILIFSSGYIIIRAALPRYTYSQLMTIGWGIFLPLTLGGFILVASLKISFLINFI